MHPLTTHMESLYACLDNHAVATAIHQKTHGTSATTIRECKDLVQRWKTRPQRNKHLEPGTAAVLWIPGHRKITGNEAADREAVRGANLPLSHHSKELSLAGAKKWARLTSKQDFLTYCSTLPNHHRQQLDQSQTQPSPAELQFTRGSLARLLAARSGHGDFAQYHDRFNHRNAERKCHCRAYTSPTHFYYCRLSSHQELLKGKNGQRLTVDAVLGTAEGAQAFQQWVEISKYCAIRRQPRNPQELLT